MTFLKFFRFYGLQSHFSYSFPISPPLHRVPHQFVCFIFRIRLAYQLHHRHQQMLRQKSVKNQRNIQRQHIWWRKFRKMSTKVHKTNVAIIQSHRKWFLGRRIFYFHRQSFDSWWRRNKVWQHTNRIEYSITYQPKSMRETNRKMKRPTTREWKIIHIIFILLFFVCFPFSSWSRLSARLGKSEIQQQKCSVVDLHSANVNVNCENWHFYSCCIKFCALSLSLSCDIENDLILQSRNMQMS